MTERVRLRRSSVNSRVRVVPDKTRMIMRKVVASTSDMLPLNHACNLHNIRPATATRWIRMGEAYARDMDRGEHLPEHEIYYWFSQAMARARAKVQERIIKRSFRKNRLNPGWIRDITFLSRIDPSNWSAQNRKEALEEERGTSSYDPDDRFL